jgi:F0F1-type ATP synthase assembly protein I
VTVYACLAIPATLERQKPRWRFAAVGKSPFRYAMIGTQMVVSVLIGSFIGRWMDLRFHSEPWCFVGGFVLGATAGLYDLLRVANER